MREMGADEAPLVLGIWWPLLGMAAGIGLVIPFVGNCVASACRLYQRHWTRRVHVGGPGGSTRPPHPDIQAAFCRIAVEISPFHQLTSVLANKRRKLV
jgi:hypothetical protein